MSMQTTGNSGNQTCQGIYIFSTDRRLPGDHQLVCRPVRMQLCGIFPCDKKEKKKWYFQKLLESPEPGIHTRLQNINMKASELFPKNTSSQETFGVATELRRKCLKFCQVPGSFHTSILKRVFSVMPLPFLPCQVKITNEKLTFYSLH